jgi:hypothetical protein
MFGAGPILPRIGDRMKLLTYETDKGTRCGVLQGEQVVDVSDLLEGQWFDEFLAVFLFVLSSI